MILYLLNDTQIRIKFNQYLSNYFDTNKGIPEGDCLSPLLFIIYIRAIILELYKKTTNHIYLLLIYSDDIDVITGDYSPQHIQALIDSIIETFKLWNLEILQPNVDESKTKLYTIKPSSTASYKNMFKLGNYLSNIKEFQRIKSSVTTSYQSLWPIWYHKNNINETTKINLYKSLVQSLFLYNASAYNFTNTMLDKLDSLHRKQLRIIINIHYPMVITSINLYKRTKTKRISLMYLILRWNFFQKILLLPAINPAKRLTLFYFSSDGHAKSDHYNLPVILYTDLRRINQNLNNIKDLRYLEQTASDCKKWKTIITLLTKSFCIFQSSRSIKSQPSSSLTIEHLIGVKRKLPFAQVSLRLKRAKQNPPELLHFPPIWKLQLLKRP